MFAVLHSLLKLLLLIPVNVESYFQWLLWTWKSLSQMCTSSTSVGKVLEQYLDSMVLNVANFQEN